MPEQEQPPLTVMTPDEGDSTLTELGNVTAGHHGYALAIITGHALGALLAVAVVDTPDGRAPRLLAAEKLRQMVAHSRTHTVLCPGC